MRNEGHRFRLAQLITTDRPDQNLSEAARGEMPLISAALDSA
jgi:hypothetical protein